MASFAVNSFPDCFHLWQVAQYTISNFAVDTLLLAWRERPAIDARRHKWEQIGRALRALLRTSPLSEQSEPSHVRAFSDNKQFPIFQYFNPLPLPPASAGTEESRIPAAGLYYSKIVFSPYCLVYVSDFGEYNLPPTAHLSLCQSAREDLRGREADRKKGKQDLREEAGTYCKEVGRGDTYDYNIIS